MVESGKSDLKYNHDSSIAQFDGIWITVWNANQLHLEARPGQFNYQSTFKTDDSRPAWADQLVHKVNCLILDSRPTTIMLRRVMMSRSE